MYIISLESSSTSFNINPLAPEHLLKFASDEEDPLVHQYYCLVLSS